MKKHFACGSILLVLAFNPTLVHADTLGVSNQGVGNTEPGATDLLYVGISQVVERSAHHNKIQTITAHTNKLGAVRLQTNSFTEIASGLNRQDLDGKWLRCDSPQITIRANGVAECTNTVQKALFAGSASAQETVELTLSDGQPLRVRPSYLAYHDFKKNQTALIAETRDAQGFISGNNKVVYPNAMDDVKCTVRYTMRKSGCEQDLILQEQLPNCEDFGFSPPSCWVELWTEVVGEHPQPRLETVVRKGWKKATYCKTIDFGETKIPQGIAFVVGNESGESIPVKKHWVIATNAASELHTFIVEEIPYQLAKRQMKHLPARQVALNREKNPHLDQSFKGTLANVPFVGRRAVAALGQRKKMQLASAGMEPAGFVIDFATVSSVGDLRLKSDTTYYVSGLVYINNLIIEGGTVVKYAYGGCIQVGTSVTCLTGPYKPAIFTGLTDNSAGEIISTASLTNTDRFADTALRLNSGENLQYLYIRYASNAIANGADYSVSHSQFLHCGVGLNTWNSYCNVTNCLMCDVTTGFNGGMFVVRAQNLTFDHGALVADWLGDPGSCPGLAGSGLLLVNSLVTDYSTTFDVEVDDAGGTVFLDSSAGVYKTAGAGNYYLADDSPYRSVGATWDGTYIVPIDSAFTATRTTWAPVILRGSITNDTVLAPEVPRDTSTNCDIGYHYDPLDFLIQGPVYLSGATVAVTNGAAVGFCLTNADFASLMIDCGSAVKSFGWADNVNHLTWYSTVQESAASNWYDMDFGLNDLFASTESGAGGSVAEMRFTHFSRPAGGGSYFSQCDVGWLGSIALRDCEFSGSAVWFWSYVYGSPGSFTGSATNCLFQRCNVGVLGPIDVPDNFQFQNCLFYSNSVSFDASTSGGSTATLSNCFFQTTDITRSPNISVLGGYNGYIVTNNPGRLTPTNAHDVLIQTIDYDTGPLGDFYLHTNGLALQLIDAGSEWATNAGFYHYTTMTNQVKEAGTILDIGYHYIAVDTNGLPFDTDGDGVADYLEDANGNGIVDSGETDWQDANDLGLKVWITDPKDGANLP